MKMGNLTKRSLALFLTIMMCLTLLPAAVLAAEEEAVPPAGTETVGTPLTTAITTIEAGATYTISNLTELKAFKTLVEKGLTFEGATVKLTADIIMADGNSWTAIGASRGSSYNDNSESKMKSFKGVFDGQGHTLKKPTFTIGNSRGHGMGFIGRLDGATVKNLRITDVSFSSNSNYGGFYGLGAVASYARNGSVIDNCYVQGTPTFSVYSTTDVDYVGGIVGAASGSTIANCTNEMTLDFKTTGRYAGGIVGQLSGGSVKNCLNTAAVASKEGEDTGGNRNGVGGIVGYLAGTAVIDRCMNTGTVTSYAKTYTYNAYTGGIVGRSNCKATISNCWNKGTIYGACHAGGMVGLSGSTNSGTYLPSYGGHNSPLEIFNCLNTGEVKSYSSTKLSYGGGMAGGSYTYNGIFVENSYNQGNIAPESSNTSPTRAFIGYATTGYSSYSGSYPSSQKPGDYTLAYIYHSYSLNYGDGGGTTNMRPYTQCGSSAVGYDSATCVSGSFVDFTAAAESQCEELNAYAAQKTTWEAPLRETLNRWDPYYGVVVTKTDESRDYAEWIYDPEGNINDGLPYLDLASDIGYNAAPVPAVTYTLSYDANAEGEDIAVPADQTVTNKKGNASFRVSRDIPVRENYKFLGWADTTDAELADYAAGGTVTITSPAVQKTIYAVWAPAHKVMWVDGYDGAAIAETMAADGEVIPISAYPTDIPQHTEDSHYAGWSPEVKNADGSYTITAEWRLAVTWVDGYSDEPVQAKYVVKYGDIESKHPSMNPTRRGYKFNGWEIGEKDGDGNVTVTAQWTSNPSYTVTWVDGLTNDVIDTKTLSSDVTVTEEDYPTVPEHDGKVFTKWVISVPDDNGDITIIALYKDENDTPAPDKYTVTWLDSIDSGVIATKDFALEYELTDEDYPAGETLPVHDGKVIDKWMVCPADADGNITIIALWKDGVPEDGENYMVIWIDSFDGTKIKTQKVDANAETPTYDYPAVESLAPHAGLKFHRWVVNDKDENGNIVIVAMWIDKNAVPEEPNEETYTVTWVDYDGSELGQVVVKKGDTVTDDEYPEEPVHDDKTFQEWVMKDKDKNGNITYIAKYEGEEIEPDDPPAPAKTYTVTWIDGYDGKVLAVKEVKEGENISQNDYPSIPTHSGYSFVKWVESKPNGDDNLVYTATWKSSNTSGGGGTTVRRPGGGGGGGSISGGSTNNNNTTTIKDVDVPLAEAPGLNSTDHVAYVIGYEDGTVRPEANISRAEVATIFYRLMTEEFRNEHRSTTNNFTDIENGIWYNNAVSTDVKAGLIKGYEDGSFAPDMNITRAEFAAVAARFLSEDAAPDSGFTDITGHWAAAEINRAVAAGWIRGKGDNIFAPDEYITRAEVMTLVNRMLNRVGNKAGMSDDMVKWTDNPEEAWYYADVQEATNSHEYVRDEQNKETWTGIVENKDWSELER